jgi:transcriptional antiterminator RfaH
MTHGSAATPHGEAWYAVRTKTCQEQRVEANLRNLGVRTLLPKLRRTDTRSNRRGSRIEPLFPGYIFVQCDIGASAHKIGYTRGVKYLLGDSTGPVSIDDEVIDLIASRVGEDGLVTIAPSFKVGDAVRVQSGPLQDLVGVFQAQLTPSERVVILLRTVSSYFRVILDASSLQLAES